MRKQGSEQWRQDLWRYCSRADARHQAAPFEKRVLQDAAARVRLCSGRDPRRAALLQARKPRDLRAHRRHAEEEKPGSFLQRQAPWVRLCGVEHALEHLRELLLREQAAEVGKRVDAEEAGECEDGVALEREAAARGVHEGEEQRRCADGEEVASQRVGGARGVRAEEPAEQRGECEVVCF